MRFLLTLFSQLDGALRGGGIDDELVDMLASTCVKAGLLDLAASGELPTAGRVAVAMGNLIERFRYALGEYEEQPASIAEGTEHHLVFSTPDSAQRSADELVDAVDVRILPYPQGGWIVGAVYPEIAPDPGFRHREQALSATAERLGGGYAGGGGVPTPIQPRGK